MEESASEEQIPAENSEELGDFQMNPNMLEYGSRIAEITDFRVIDDKGMCSNTIEKGSEFKIRMKVRFNEDIQEPIMAYTFKNIQGTEITGTNTMYENAKVERSGKGDTCTVTFTQTMNLQGGEYLLSFGCTGYKNGDFTVFHRLYDACNITVISHKNPKVILILMSVCIDLASLHRKLNTGNFFRFLTQSTCDGPTSGTDLQDLFLSGKWKPV